MLLPLEPSKKLKLRANERSSISSVAEVPSRTCIRQRTSAYVSIRQHTSAYVSIRQRTSAYVSICQRTSAYVSIRQHTSAYVSIRHLLRLALAAEDAHEFVRAVALEGHHVAEMRAHALRSRRLVVPEQLVHLAYVSIRQHTSHALGARRVVEAEGGE